METHRAFFVDGGVPGASGPKQFEASLSALVRVAKRLETRSVSAAFCSAVGGVCQVVFHVSTRGRCRHGAPRERGDGGASPQRETCLGGRRSHEQLGVERVDTQPKSAVPNHGAVQETQRQARRKNDARVKESVWAGDGPNQRGTGLDERRAARRSSGRRHGF